MTSSSTKHCFTLHHWTVTDWDHLPKLCESNPHIIYLKVAQENGKEGDSPHLQGCVIFDSKYKQRESKVSKILMGPNKDVRNPNAPRGSGHHYHVSTMKGTYQQASDYCGNIAKEGSVPIYEYGEIPNGKQGIQGKRTDFHEAQEVIKEKTEAGWRLDEIADLLPKFWAENEKWVRGRYNKYRRFRTDFFDENEMFKWQKELVTYLNDHQPDKRKILFVVDEAGNGGKSEIVKNSEFLFPNKRVFSIPPQDYKSMASLMPDDGVDIFILDCPRQKQYDIPYEFLENLKDGSTVQTKYEVTKKEFVTPHVVVMMNRNPKTGKTILTEDRYVVIEIQLEPEEREHL